MTNLDFNEESDDECKNGYRGEQMKNKLETELTDMIASLITMRDNQTQVKCPDDETKPCICNQFDLAIDELQELLETFNKISKIQHYQDMIDNEPNMEHHVRQGYLESISRLE